MDLSEAAIEDDIYLYFWIRRLIILLDKGEVYRQFCEANNLENETESSKEERREYLSKLWDFSDVFFEKIFLPRTLRTYEKLGEPDGVVIKECMLKFHDQDRRAYIRDTFFA